MKPGTFGVFLILLVLFGAIGGGAVGYLLHEPNPYAASNPTKPTAEGIGTAFLRGMVGTEAIDAAYEESRRRWAAGGAGGGAVLGLLSAVAIGSYSLRYRANGAAPAKT